MIKNIYIQFRKEKFINIKEKKNSFILPIKIKLNLFLNYFNF